MLKINGLFAIELDKSRSIRSAEIKLLAAKIRLHNKFIANLNAMMMRDDTWAIYRFYMYMCSRD